MFRLNKRDQRIIELMLLAVVVGLTCLVYRMDSCKLVTLNLFFLPIVLGAFFSAGIPPEFWPSLR